MADQGENQEDAQRNTESRSTEGQDLNSEARESSEDHRHETESRSSEKKPSESSKYQTDHIHQTESRSSEEELEEGEIRDQSDAEMQSRSQETKSIVLPLKKRDTFSDWRPSEYGSESGYPYGLGEADCPNYLRTGRCGLGEACHFNHPTRLFSVSKFCQNGSDCKFVHPQERHWRYDERWGSRTMPATRGMTISDSREREARRRGAQENEQKARMRLSIIKGKMRERTTPDSRDRDSRESRNGNDIKNASVPEVDDPDSNLKPSTDVDMSDQSVQPSPLVPNKNKEPMKDTEIDEEFSGGSLDCWASETDQRSDEEFDEYRSRSYVPPVVQDIDPEVLAALPPDIREEVLAEQRIVRGGPAVTDNATSGLLALQNLQPRTNVPPAVKDINPEFLAAGPPIVREGYLRGGPVDPGFVHKLPDLLTEANSYTNEIFASLNLQPRTYVPPVVENIDPEFLAALPPEIREEVLGQQRNVRGQPVATDNASVNTIDPEYLQELPAHLREEILLGCSEENLQSLPPHLLAEARILRERAMVHQLHQQEQRQRQQQNIEQQRREAQENVQEQRQQQNTEQQTREAQENVQGQRQQQKTEQQTREAQENVQGQRQQQKTEQQTREAQENVQKQRQSVEKLSLKAKTVLDSQECQIFELITSLLSEEIVAGFKLARMEKAIPDPRGFARFGEISHIIDEIVKRFKQERSAAVLGSMAQENPSEQSVEDEELEEMVDDQYLFDQRQRKKDSLKKRRGGF